MSKIAVLGTGSWGTVLANLLVENGHDVQLWGRNQDIVQEINQEHTNRHYLPHFHLHSHLKAQTDIGKALAAVELVLFVVPTNAIRSVAKKVKPQLEKMTVKPLLVHAAKGIELSTKLRISQVLDQLLPVKEFGEVVVISGPSHAEEVAKKEITMLTVASKNLKSAEKVQRLLGNDYFRLYTNSDVVGVEIGGALKNIIALGAGIANGLGYGDNAKAALMTRGLAEISRFGSKLGANPLTFSGLSGLGDLIVTCTSNDSRNWRAGNQLGKGKSLDQVLAEMGQIVEGVYTDQAVHFAAKDLNVSMPIVDALYEILYENNNIKTGIKKLMNRDLKPEFQ